jgi:hypothetical protein
MWVDMKMDIPGDLASTVVNVKKGWWVFGLDFVSDAKHTTTGGTDGMIAKLIGALLGEIIKAISDHDLYPTRENCIRDNLHELESSSAASIH